MKTFVIEYEKVARNRLREGWQRASRVSRGGTHDHYHGNGRPKASPVVGDATVQYYDNLNSYQLVKIEEQP